MSNHNIERVAFDLFCDDVNNLMQGQGQIGWYDRDAEFSNPAFQAFVDAETPEEFVYDHGPGLGGGGWL